MNDYDTITTTFQDVPVWIPFCPQRNAEPIPRARPQRSGDVPHHSGGCSKDPRRKLQSCIKTSQVS